MDSLPSKDQAFAYLKGWGNKVKQYAYNLTPMELKVEEATNNDAWGPTGTLMAGDLCASGFPAGCPCNSATSANACLLCYHRKRCSLSRLNI